MTMSNPCRTRVSFPCCAAALIASAWCASANGAVIHVPADYPTIQIAVVLTVTGDEVIVAPGVYHENVNMAGRRITLRSSGGAGVTTIDGGGADAVLRFQNCEADTIVQGFTITGGLASEGGGLHMQGSGPVIRDCVIEGNTALCAGGGVWSGTGFATFESCTIRDNAVLGCGDGSAAGAGVFASGGSISFTDCAIDSNRSDAPATAWGVGLRTVGTVVQMSGTSIVGNDGSASLACNGAGMSHDGSFAVIADCIIESNLGGLGGGAGGGVCELATTSNYVRCNFRDNAHGGNGGAMTTESGATTLTDCSFTGNTALAGGGVFAGGSNVQIAGSSFCDNAPTDIEGPHSDLGGNTFGACCSGDITGPAGQSDGVVDAIDFLMMVGQWGACSGCASDITGPSGDSDGTVDALDFLQLISAWGTCP